MDVWKKWYFLQLVIYQNWAPKMSLKKWTFPQLFFNLNAHFFKFHGQITNTLPMNSLFFYAHVLHFFNQRFLGLVGCLRSYAVRVRYNGCWILNKLHFLLKENWFIKFHGQFYAHFFFWSPIFFRLFNFGISIPATLAKNA